MTVLVTRPLTREDEDSACLGVAGHRDSPEDLLEQVDKLLAPRGLRVVLLTEDGVGGSLLFAVEPIPLAPPPG